MGKKLQARRHKAATENSRLSRGKKMLFAALFLILVGVAAELVLALVGVKPLIAESDPYVGFQSRIPLFVKDRDETQREIYRTAPNKLDHFNLWLAALPTGRTAEARQSFRIAIRNNPQLGEAYYRLGASYMAEGEFSEAASVLRQGLLAILQDMRLLERLAWILATSPHVASRNGEEAVRLAGQACRLVRYKDAQCLDTLAAAYAECGRFDEAIQTIQRALVLTSAGEQAARVATLQRRLERYAAGRPLRHRTP